MKKNNVEWLDRSLLASPFYALCLNEKQFKKALKQLELPRKDWPSFLATKQSNATCHFFEKGDGSIACLVCMHDYEDREMYSVCGLLVHEAVHIWQEYRKFIGEKEPSSEFEAYSIQWIAQSLIDSFIRQTSK